VEFQRQGGGVISSSVRTFDLLIKQRSTNTVRCAVGADGSLLQPTWQGHRHAA
jgi:hypothetical protein